MNNMYVLTETLSFYGKDECGFPVLESSNYEVKGVFDDVYKLRMLIAKLLARTSGIIGEENVYRNELTEIWYKTPEGKEAWLKYDMTLVHKLNAELPAFLSTDEEF